MAVNLLLDLSIIIIVAAISGHVLSRLKQPLILAYIFSGILLGPMCLSMITNTEGVTMLSELGIAFLLFIVGVEIDLHKVRRIGKVSAALGFLQVLFTIGASGFLALTIGVDFIESIYVGVILAFSSTMVVIKLLSERKEMGTLHGRLILGLLLMQDLLAMIFLPLLATLDNFTLMTALIAASKGAGLFFIAILANRYVFPPILKAASKDGELMFLTSVSVCFFFIGLSYYLEVSIAMGAFVAGLAIASFPHNVDIAGKIRPLRSFFATLFFVTLGMQLNIRPETFSLPLFILFALVSMLIKPLIIAFLAKNSGYRGSVPLLTGLGLAQISEFSLIIANQGLSSGHLSVQTFSSTILVTLISIVFSTYALRFGNRIYHSFIAAEHAFEKLEPKTGLRNHVVLFGAHRVGSRLLSYLLRRRKKVVVVDYDPDVISFLSKKKCDYIYGDACNENLLEKLNIQKAKLVVSTLPDVEDNAFIIRHVRSLNKDAVVFARAHHSEQAVVLYSMGADYVIFPEMDSSEKVVERAVTALAGKGKEDMKELKKHQLEEIKKYRDYTAHGKLLYHYKI